MAITTVQIAVLGDDGTVIAAIPPAGVAVADATTFIDDLARAQGYDITGMSAQLKAEKFLQFIMRTAVGTVHNQRRRDAIEAATVTVPEWGEQG